MLLKKYRSNEKRIHWSFVRTSAGEEAPRENVSAWQSLPAAVSELCCARWLALARGSSSPALGGSDVLPAQLSAAGLAAPPLTTPKSPSVPPTQGLRALASLPASSG